MQQLIPLIYLDSSV